MTKKRVRRGESTPTIDPAEKSRDGELTTARHARNPLAISFNASLALICAVGLCLRLIHTLQTSTVPTTIELIGDARGYVDWGRAIAAGNWYGSETFYQAPLYPYFLAVIFKWLSTSVMVVRLLQAVLGTAAIACLAIASRNLFSPRVALVAAGMLALYPPVIYYDGLIQKAALASFLLCALLAVISILPKYFHPLPAVGVGILLGLLVLTRENALLWIPLVPSWILLGFRESNWGQRRKVTAGYVVGLLLVLFPVAARNASLGGEWSPTTFQSGPNFYIGNNIEANGVYRALIVGHETPEFERADAERLAELDVGHRLTPREVSRYWMNLAFTDIASDPVRWIQLMILKVGMVVNRYEVPDVESFYVHRFWSAPLTALQHVWHFGILCPVAILGLFVTRHRWRELWLHYLLILSMIFAVGLFFILGRYRLPLVPLLIPLAASAIVDWRAILTYTGRLRMVCATTTLAAIILCNLPLHDERGLNASSYMNVGISAGQAGDLPTCLKWLEAAAELNDESAVTHYNLAGAQAMSGRPLEAINSLLRAKQIRPDLVQVDLQLAMLYEQIGRPREAIVHYKNALASDPADTQAQEALKRLSNLK